MKRYDGAFFDATLKARRKKEAEMITCPVCGDVEMSRAKMDQHIAEHRRAEQLPTAPKLPDRLPGHWDTNAGLAIAMDYANQTRNDLAHGLMTDMELANRINMADRGDLDLIAWQTAAKERIRWLSVQLALALARQPS